MSVVLPARHGKMWRAFEPGTLEPMADAACRLAEHGYERCGGLWAAPDGLGETCTFGGFFFVDRDGGRAFSLGLRLVTALRDGVLEQALDVTLEALDEDMAPCAVLLTHRLLFLVGNAEFESEAEHDHWAAVAREKLLAFLDKRLVPATLDCLQP